MQNPSLLLITPAGLCVWGLNNCFMPRVYFATCSAFPNVTASAAPQGTDPSVTGEVSQRPRVRLIVSLLRCYQCWLPLIVAPTPPPPPPSHTDLQISCPSVHNITARILDTPAPTLLGGNVITPRQGQLAGAFRSVL